MQDFLSTHGSQNLVFVIKLQQIAIALPVTMAQREDTSSVELLLLGCIPQCWKTFWLKHTDLGLLDSE